MVGAGAESFWICAAATSGFTTTLFAFNWTVGRRPGFEATVPVSGRVVVVSVRESVLRPGESRLAPSWIASRITWAFLTRGR